MRTITVSVKVGGTVKQNNLDDLQRQYAKRKVSSDPKRRPCYEYYCFILASASNILYVNSTTLNTP